MVPDLLVLDFDGVILESADIKTRAFRELFSCYPGHVGAIVAYHEANTGLSRFEKFRHIYRDILGKPLRAEEERVLGDRFSSLVLKEVMRCPFVPGAMEFLRRHSVQRSLFVASGTPEGELRQIVESRGLVSLFRGVYGSPSGKPEILNGILASTQTNRERALFIGDGLSDYMAAKAVGIPFIGRTAPHKSKLFEGLDVPVVADLFELDRRLSDPAGI